MPRGRGGRCGGTPGREARADERDALDGLAAIERAIQGLRRSGGKVEDYDEAALRQRVRAARAAIQAARQARGADPVKGDGNE